MTTDTHEYWQQHHARGASLDTVGWTGLGRAFNARMYEVRRRLFLRVVPRFVPVSAETRVLDVGSGTGFYLQLWRELRVRHLEGSDIAERAVEHLRESFPDVPLHVLHLGSGTPPVAEGGYDVVSAMDMLFHIVDDDVYRGAIDALSQLVRPGGHVVLSENLLDGRRVSGPEQVSRSETEIMGLLRDAGLEPLVCVPMFVLLNGPVDSRGPWLSRWWTALTKLVSRDERIGAALGAALLPLESALITRVRRGPSTKLVICRRVAGQATGSDEAGASSATGPSGA